jgi:hypothetical protein
MSTPVSKPVTTEPNPAEAPAATAATTATTATTAKDVPTSTSSLSDLAPAGAPLPAPTEGMLVAACTEARHPTLLGRVRCRLTMPSGEAVERWFPTLMHLPVRQGDRVLLARPANFAEAIVVGVLDGFTPRPEAPAEAAATRTLASDETVRFESARGVPLLEIGPGPAGPVVRLLSDALDVETKGALRVRAATIELSAQRGALKLEASDDVVVQGEAIHLN